MKKYFLTLVLSFLLLVVFVIPSHAQTCSEDIDNVDLGFPLEGNPSDYEIFLPFGVAWCNDDGDCWEDPNRQYHYRHLGMDLKLLDEESVNTGDSSDPDNGDGTRPQVTKEKEVKAAYAGYACKYNASGIWGMGVYVRHEMNGYVFYTIYTHVSSIDSDIPLLQHGPCTAADGGHPVGKGDVLAQILNLNNSDATDRDHLHFAIRCDDFGQYMKCGGGHLQSNGNVNCINPLPFFESLQGDKRPNIDKYFTGVNQTYPDVPIGEWYYEPVERLTWKGIVKGYLPGNADGIPSGNFNPLGNVNRVELIKMAVEASGKRCCDLCNNCSDCLNCDSISYGDVPSGHWGEKYLRVAHTEGWISQNAGDFSPADGATRYWVAKVLVKAKKGWDIADAPSYMISQLSCRYSPFEDIKEAETCHPDDPYAWQAYKEGIFVGHFENECPSAEHPNGVEHPGTELRYFCGTQIITRAEAATAIGRTFLDDGSQQ